MITRKIFSKKYSDGAKIDVSLACRNGRIILKVVDDGKGFDPDAAGREGLGLPIMRYRARAINATLTIQRRKQAGMEVRCTVPTTH